MLVDWAPEEATGYRLAIRRDNEPSLTYFPRVGVFDLYPIEPPQVPIAGHYVVTFYDRDGASLKTPSTLLQGLFVEHPDPIIRFPNER
jgi:hypothetical protein